MACPTSDEDNRSEALPTVPASCLFPVGPGRDHLFPVTSSERRSPAICFNCPFNDTNIFLHTIVLLKCNHDDGHSLCGCVVGATQRIPLSVLARNPHKRACARGLPRDRKWMREGRFERGQKDLVSRREQKRPEETSRQNRSVRRWESGREETSQQKLERRLLGPVDLHMPGWPMREDESAFLVALWKFRANYTPMIACKCTESCTKVSQTPPLLRLELTQARMFVLLLFHTLVCVFCVSLKEC